MANYLRAGADYSAAIELTRAAVAEADRGRAARPASSGNGTRGGRPRQARGSPRRASRRCAAGLALALEHDLTPVAAELYQRLSLVLYDGADYRSAQEALDSALGLCRADDTGTAVACVTCMVYVLRECGDWDEALKLGRELISSDTAVWVAEGLIGAIHGYQGKFGSARRLLLVLPGHGVAGRPLQHVGRHDRRAGVGGGRRGRRTRRRPSTAARCSRAGRTARTTTTP